MTGAANPAEATVARLATRTHELLSPLGDPSAGYALLDFPDYTNVGDSLIWLGEIAYFDRHVRRRPDHACTAGSFDPERLRKEAPQGPIYLSGGGNFGDIWPRFQQFRHQVLESMRGRRVIQLPQTLLFRDPANIDATREAIRRHGDFVLMVRDQRSLAFAREHFPCETVLAPDMAFCMGTLEAPTPVTDIALLARGDQESAATVAEIRMPVGLSVHQEDWIAWPSPTRTQLRLRKLQRRLGLRTAERQFFDVASSERTRGVALLGSGRVVATDRLHGHILSLLIGRPHVVVDNNYGKIGGIMDEWTGTDPLVHRARNFAEAGEIAARLVRGG